MMEPMPRVPPFDRRATYEDLKKVPDIMVAEIVDGELHASPRPALPHAHAASAVGVLIGGPFHFSRGGPGGWVILDEPELHLGRNVVVPDLAGWRRTRLPEVPKAPFSTLAPDWVCEVSSPSTAMLDRAKKLRIYARAKVGYAWIIDPSARLLEVLQLEAGRWVIAAAHAGAKVVRAEPFSELPLDLGLLWTGEPDDAASSRPAAGRRRRAEGSGKRTVTASRSGAERRPRRR
jgi:Uma2 family endonuclease